MKKNTRIKKFAKFTPVYALAALFIAFFALFYRTGELDFIPTVFAEKIDSEVPGEPIPVSSNDVFVPAKSIVFQNARYIRVVSGGIFQIEWNVMPEESIESLYWYSTNEAVASVSQNGEINAIEPGEAFIIAENYNRSISKQVLVTVRKAPPRILDIPYINQLRNYPNGCESCSTVMALNYAGVDIDVDTFIDDFLDMAPLPAVNKNGVYSGKSPWNFFLGDPRLSTGLCCYAPAITNALTKLLPADDFLVEEHRGEPLEELCRKYIDKKIPVIFWGTISMDKPYLTNWSWKIEGEEDETFTWVAPMHCMLLIGYDDNFYYFNDPISGKGVSYTKKDTELAYEGLYKQAVTITPVSNGTGGDKNVSTKN